MPPESSAHPPDHRHLRNAPAAEMNETVARAAELLARDQGNDPNLDRMAALAAADELGIPQPYLERAAEELHTERVAAERRRRLRLRLGAGLAAAVLLVAGAVAAVRIASAPPDPIVYTFAQSPAPTWRLETNPESRASLDFREESGRGAVAVVQVQQFGPAGADGSYFVNLNTVDGPLDMDGHAAVMFSVRGEGLGRIRLYLEAGGERWRSPEVTVTGDWRDVRLSLDRFERQTRNPAGDGWRTVGYEAPGRVERLSFKLGTFINDDKNSSGEVVIDDVRVE